MKTFVSKKKKLILVIIILNIMSEIEASLSAEDSGDIRLEKLLTEFMTDLKKFTLDRIASDHVTVLGKNSICLQATKVVLEDYIPCFIGTNPEAVIPYSYSGTDSVILFFVDGLSDTALKSSIGQISAVLSRRVLLISVYNTTYETVYNAVLNAERSKLWNMLFVRLDNAGEMKIYKNVVGPNCSPQVVPLNAWTRGIGFLKNSSVFEEENVIINGLGCPMFVSTMNLMPTMKLRRGVNDTSRIVGGIEGHLIRSIAEQMNFTPIVKKPSAPEKFLVLPNGTFIGVIADVAEEKVHLGIGQIRPTLRRAMLVDFTVPYNHECIVWTVPARANYDPNILRPVFSPAVSILAILSVLLSGGLSYVTWKLKAENCRSPEFDLFDVISVSLTHAIPRPPASLLGKLFFLLYLNYSRVLSTAYSASLASILATRTPMPTIVDEKGILDAGLRTSGTATSRDMLADQITPESDRAELLNRYEVITRASEALARISRGEDLAYLRHLSTINYITARYVRAGKFPTFHPLRDQCVISYNSVIVTPKGSFLTDEMNKIIRRITQSGIYEYWTNIDNTVDKIVKSPYSHSSYTLTQLQSIFVLYLFCLVPAFLAFITELIISEININKCRSLTASAVRGRKDR
ncbi:uncharacterized protein LOC124185971 [Neodiprion fabricii]|uniref:uncharacterized protein LOC124185971 n=1 Tax=Neodiprion fabricii TaxID=2872261 RepID=UPI001ED94F55|nr:uncharacterized protein LOC124185971 [Neodiprion fabricii]